MRNTRHTSDDKLRSCIRDLVADAQSLEEELQEVERMRPTRADTVREILDALGPVLQRCWEVDRGLVEYRLRRLGPEPQVAEQVTAVLFRLACGRAA